MYAEIALNVPLFTTFTYSVPAGLEVKVGHLVQVPFRTGTSAGIVMGLLETTPIEQTKDIEALIDPAPVVKEEQVALSRWMSETYFAPIGMCVWLWVPSGLDGHHDTLFTLVDRDYMPANESEAKLLAMLRKRGSLRLRQIKTSMRDEKVRGLLDALKRAGVLSAASVLTPPRVRPQTVQTVELAIHPDQIGDVQHLLGQKSRRADLLEAIATLTTHTAAADIKTALKLAGSTRDTLRRLADENGLVIVDDDQVRLAIPREAIDGQLITLRKAETDLHVLRVLARHTEPLDVSWLYAQTGAKLAHLRRLEELDLIAFGEKETWRDSLAKRDFVPAVAPQLTPEQANIWRTVYNTISGGGGQFLLHGVTGSGKTEIYLRAIEETLAQGRQVIFLVPEIALTAQTVRRVVARFPGKVAVFHSRLSEGERFDTWRRARERRAPIIVGARSALFLPLPEVGLIVLDEEHDGSYKNFSAPAYDAREVAAQIIARHGGTLILGSATPDLSTYYRATRGDCHYLHMPNRIMGHRVRIEEQAEREGVTTRYHDASADALTINLPPVEVVDMRDELKRGNTTMFSDTLREALKETLARREQAILFLNRRGTATYVFCRDCGYIQKCDLCEIPLTHHSYDDMLRCHHCGHSQPPPQRCPKCHSRRIRYFGAGTQQVEETVMQEFPRARIVRWDADTASHPEMHDAILLRFLNHEADLMVGTQMVAKGLDLPLVTLVGVVSADTGLGLPDYRASERLFQVLTQVAGRAGRGILGGRVVLQTYHPDNYAIQAASQHDYFGFYRQELEYRRQMGYPPFRKLARIVFQSHDGYKAESDATAAAHILRHTLDQLDLTATELIGPAPCFFARTNGVYRWHLLIRSPEPLTLLRAVEVAHRWHVEIDPYDML